MLDGDDLEVHKGALEVHQEVFEVLKKYGSIGI